MTSRRAALSLWLGQLAARMGPSLGLFLLIGLSPGTARAQSLPPLYPEIGPGTHILDHDKLLSKATLNDPGWYASDLDWYKANIPFLDVPDKTIEAVYYYRWSVVKRNLRNTGKDGYISTEFIPPVGWGNIFNSLNDASGHHIHEDRWLRDQRYMNDYEKFWLTGSGVKFAHHFSADWLADAVLARAKVGGDLDFAQTLLPKLIVQYDGWNKQFDAKMGLYWSTPARDAMEFEPASLESSNPFAGVPTYRPTLNSYQYGNAMAISEVARRVGDTATASNFLAKANALRENIIKWLWDPERHFFYDIIDPGNPEHKRLDTREEVGYIPWYFDIPGPAQSIAWRQLTDPQGFAAPYGPTTTERRSHWFMDKADDPRGWDGGCCHWNGPSWPFATAQTLTGMANLLRDYRQDIVTVANFDALLHTYAATQFKNGHPWVAEAADPDTGRWIYDAEDHSEHYFHSTFNDIVIAGLIGLRPRLGRTLVIDPLVPTFWKYFCLENVPYHGHNITILWDRTGEHYHHGTGLTVYQDGKPIAHTTKLQTITVKMAATRKFATDVAAPWFNAAANLSGDEYPKAIASYYGPQGSPRQAIDGQVLYDQFRPASRWTDFRSGHRDDWLGVDFGQSTRVQDVRIYLDGAGGNFKEPKSCTLQYWTGSAWSDAPEQKHIPVKPALDQVNRVTLKMPLFTTKIRVVFSNSGGPYGYVAVTELESWVPPLTTAGQKSVRPSERSGLSR
ncbi:MAG: discoidin domain-containing protein [Rhodanobacter sp.]